MALCDYRVCDICKKKAFYDANLHYEWADTIPSELTFMPIKGRSYALHNVGDWQVICQECSKTHECIIIKKKDEKE